MAAPRLLVAIVATLVILTAAGGATAQERLILTVGIPNDIGSLNPIVGVEVPDYEVWNLHYATLTDKAAEDFETIPGLAESWEGSEDGLTWTYTLREGLLWSDGEPLTADDVVFTINRAREEAWLNYDSTVANITASAPDERTVVLESSVPDPKLPTMDVYILPEHIWGELGPREITRYDGLDGVGSGPFTIAELRRGEFWRLEANENYWAGRPAIDEVVFRLFNNTDAMVAALTAGEIDAAHYVPEGSFQQLSETEGIETIEGQQGGFDELAVNGGDGLADPHPALLDLRVRQAVAHAIDEETIIDRVLEGLGSPSEAMSPSANPEWIPEIPDEERFDFDLDRARELLDEGGYEDTDGDGIREMPGGGEPLDFVFAVRTESQPAPGIAEFVSGWLEEIGIAVTQRPMNDSRLLEVIGRGNYDMFVWGWVPFVDPDPMLSYFKCDQIASDPEDPTNYYNDANLCDPEYDRLYEEQKVELDHERRVEIVHEMLRRFYSHAVYHVLYLSPDLQAYRTDRFTGWVRQPADVGPVMFSNSSPSYALLRPVSEEDEAAGGGGEAAAATDDDGGMSTGTLVALVALALLVVAAAVWILRRRRTVDERD
ncbi:MAG TPA: ABC transporter substrate-binding protein [Gaiellaceae bacterium]|nr:ABC transporter substrate-binding protein [Gaiellaceae bacterium]